MHAAAAALLLHSDDRFNWLLIRTQTATLAAATSGARWLLRLCQPGRYLPPPPPLPGALWVAGAAPQER